LDPTATSILLACLSYADEAARAEQLAHVSAETWSQVTELAQKQDVATLLYRHIRSLNIALPGDAAEKLKRIYRQNTLRNLRWYQQLAKLLRLLQDRDVPLIVLKEAYLAEAVYGDIGLRTMEDVDLLVRKDDLLRVEHELLAAGCIPQQYHRVISPDNHHFQYALPGGGPLVEIHWAILDPSYSSQIDMDELWSRAQHVTLAQSPALALCPEDLLLHLCLHTAVHAFDMRTRMLCDIGEVVGRWEAELDWQGIGTRARQWGHLRAIYVILRLARELLGVAVPADWLISLRPEGFDECYLEQAREQILAPSAEGDINQLNVARMWRLKGLGSKLAMARDRLFISRETMALQYPAPANSWRIFLYYPARIQDGLLRHGATLWRRARGDQGAQNIAEQTDRVSTLLDWLMSG